MSIEHQLKHLWVVFSKCPFSVPKSLVFSPGLAGSGRGYSPSFSARTLAKEGSMATSMSHGSWDPQAS